MYRLPTGAGGQAAQYSRAMLLMRVRNWAKAHDLEFEHDTAGYELHIHFLSKDDMTFFLLSFDNPTLFKIVD